MSRSGALGLGPAGPMLVEVWGHSLAQAGSGPLPAGDRDSYAVKVAKALGAKRLNNRAIGGAVSCWPTAGTNGDGGVGWVLQTCRRPGSPGYGNFAAHPEAATAPYMPRSQVIIDHMALNDLSSLGSQTPRPMQEAHRTKWSRYAACAVWEAADGSLNNAAPWVETGTWTNASGGFTSCNSGAGIRYSTTVGDKKAFTVPSDAPTGRVWAFCFWMNAVHDLTVGVKINGVSQPDVRLTGSVLCDQGAAARHQPVMLRFGARPSGAALSPLDFPGIQLSAGDVVEFTYKTANVGGSLFAPNFGQIEADPLDGPLIVVPLNHKPMDYSLFASATHGPNAGTDPMNDASVDAWNVALQAIAAEFPGRMVLADMSALSTKDQTLVGTPPPGDHTHWNIKGHGIAAEQIVAAIQASGLLTRRVLTRASVDPDPFYKPAGVFGFPALINSWTVNAGSNVDQLGVHRDLSDRVHWRGWASKTTGAPSDRIVNSPPGYRRNKLKDQPVVSFTGAAWQNAIVRQDTATVGDIFMLLNGSVAAGSVNIINLDYFANA